ncbi:hypothetical protein QEJ31_01070 [Pigmentibacter sp. JX0631]|uniref:hypothetical protein n=1 Tax=Pigmentibacter sp. JX0631 TaxID=2976982 RepID=UPI0024689246|nr:hypothetical protein [Pigmentibacter sp. JX0631]WGL60194.1 hypothetical protein QEJ31_01070 [Pigmentibacter sp. JX0631]
MIVLFDTRTRILQISSLFPSSKTIHRGVCLFKEEFLLSPNIIIINLKFKFVKQEYIPDYRLYVNSKILTFIIKNLFLFINMSLNLKKNLKYFAIIKKIFFLISISLITTKFLYCGLFYKKIEDVKLNYNELLQKILFSNGKEIILGNQSSMVYAELSNFYYSQNIKYIKTKNISSFGSNKVNKKILVTYYSKLFLLNEDYKLIQPIYSCSNKDGVFYIFIINLVELNEVLIFNDININNKKYGILLFPYESYSSYSVENFCRIRI